MEEFGAYASVYDKINSQKDYQGECNFVYRWAEMPKDVMDIGAGTASYWDYFKCNLRGIEKSQKMIDLAKYKSSIKQGDVTTFDFGGLARADAVFALFDVINYIDHHEWWENLPLKPGGYFIFDIWNAEKVHKDGFTTTIHHATDGTTRMIVPHLRFKDRVNLNISVETPEGFIREKHQMFIYTKGDIRRFCGNMFKVVDIVETKTWQQYWKLKRL